MLLLPFIFQFEKARRDRRMRRNPHRWLIPWWITADADSTHGIASILNPPTYSGALRRHRVSYSGRLKCPSGAKSRQATELNLTSFSGQASCRFSIHLARVDKKSSAYKPHTLFRELGCQSK